MEISGRRFLLAGGASLIGSHLTEQLLKAGAGSVVLFDNYSLGSPQLAQDLARDPRVKLVRGDVLRLNDLYDNLDGVDGVFALAAFLTLPLSQNLSLGLDVNVSGMHNILEACRWRGVRKVVFSSSVAVYGDPDVSTIDENVPFRWQAAPPSLVLYASTKIIGEALCRLYKQRHGLDYIALRYSTVYGERQHDRGLNALHILDAYRRIKAGQRPILPDDGSEGHDYIYAGDVARANHMAMASEISGESFLIASGVDTSLNDLVRIVLRIAGSNLQPEYSRDPNRLKTTSGQKLGYAPEKAKKMLGWEAKVPLEEGVRRLLAWADR